MLELINNQMKFSFPDVHANAKCGITFERTLRIPDDGKQYHLPPSIGNFPTLNIDDLPKEKVPEKWREHGGVLLPMYQAEAMWINFHPEHRSDRASAYPFAIRIATGKVSAITGKVFVKNMKEGDYIVLPNQPWLDGFVVDDDFIRQFVASPLGSGVSVEQQITGEDKIGGLQIEVIPMKRDIYEKKFPKQKHVTRGGPALLTKGGSDFALESMAMSFSTAPAAALESVPDMSLAAGGKMKQKIEADPFGLDVWDVDNTSRVFVHLTNSMVWRAITGTEPPTVPPTAKEYTNAGLPWFDYYSDAPTVKATGDMKDIKSMKDMGGSHMLPENESVDETDQVKDLSAKKKSPHEVREGNF